MSHWQQTLFQLVVTTKAKSLVKSLTKIGLQSVWVFLTLPNNCQPVRHSMS